MGAEENKEILRRLYQDVFCRGDREVLNEIVVPGFANHSVQRDGCQCRDDYWQVISQLRSAVPDLEISVEDQVADEEKVACRVTIRGTFVAPYAGILPTGEQIDLGGVSVFRLENGKVVEGWSHSDPLVGAGHVGHQGRRRLPLRRRPARAPRDDAGSPR
jgi:predicted ester cyclase